MTYVDRYPIHVIYANDQADQSVSLSDARQLVVSDHVQVVEGPLISSAIAVVAPGLGRTADAAISTGDAVTTAQQATSTLTPVLAGVLLLFMVVLGVFKPGRRRKPSDRPGSRPAG